MKKLLILNTYHFKKYLRVWC